MAPNFATPDDGNDGGEEEEMTTMVPPPPKRRGKVSMRGFCKSVPQFGNDPRGTVSVVRNMLEKAAECGKDSEEGELVFFYVFPRLLFREVLPRHEPRTSISINFSSRTTRPPESRIQAN